MCLSGTRPGDAAKTNVFAIDPTPGSATSELGLSDKGRAFLGGIMKHAAAMSAITNPTVNSYKRLNAPVTLSGATWAPNTVTWTGNNRTHMVRVPGPGRFELRLPDGAANPYLLQAVIIAAGLDGHGQRRRSRQAPRHRHVCRGPQGARRGETAAQHARRAQGL
jgi:glutamine synthetase